MTEQVTRDKREKTVKMPLLFADFEAGEQIAAKLIKDIHVNHCHANIKFIERNIAKKRNKNPVPGSVYKVNPMFKHLTDADFIVEVALEVWNDLDPNQRVALIDHLLTRIVVEENEVSGEMKFSVRSPEIQEFPEVVERNGQWHPGLVEFGQNMK